MRRTPSRLYRRKDSKYWWAVFVDPQGRVLKVSTGCRDHQAASLWLSAQELARVRAEAGVPTAKPISLADAAGEFLAEREVEWSAGWFDCCTSYFKREIVPFFGDVCLSTLTAGDAMRFRAAQARRTCHFKNEKKTLNAATVNRVLACLGAFGSWAVERGYLVKNTLKAEPLPESDAPPAFFTDEEIEKVLAVVSPRWRCIFTLALETAMRKGELSRLRWEHIDFDGGIVHVVSSHESGLTKSRKSRELPMTMRARETLRSLPRPLTGGLVFPRIPDPRRAYQAASKALGKRFWMHALRHTAASRLAAAGASPVDLLALGGWASLDMVQRYSHTNAKRLRELAERASLGA